MLHEKVTALRAGSYSLLLNKRLLRSDMTRHCVGTGATEVTEPLRSSRSSAVGRLILDQASAVIIRIHTME